MIISILNQKGGVGKTTLATHIATCLAMLGNKILLVDADPQASTLEWIASRKKDKLFNVVGLPKPILHIELRDIKKDYDHIIIDGPPRLYDVARSTIVASDLVVIPVTPSPYDIWAAEDVVKQVIEVKESISEYKTVKAAFCINRKITNTALGRDVKEALDNYSLDVFDNCLHQRVIYAETAAIGSTVLEETDKSNPANIEVRNLVEEILQKYNK